VQFQYHSPLQDLEIALIINYTSQNKHKRYWNEECNTKGGPKYRSIYHIKDLPV